MFPPVLHPLFNSSNFATSKTKDAGKHAKASGRNNINNNKTGAASTETHDAKIMKNTSIKLQELRNEAKVTTISQAIKSCYSQCITGGDEKAEQTAAIFAKFKGINGVLSISGIIYKAMHIGEVYEITKADGTKIERTRKPSADAVRRFMTKQQNNESVMNAIDFRLAAIAASKAAKAAKCDAKAKAEAEATKAAAEAEAAVNAALSSIK